MGFRVRLRCSYNIYIEIPRKHVEIQHWPSEDVLFVSICIYSFNEYTFFFQYTLLSTYYVVLLFSGHK